MRRGWLAVALGLALMSSPAGAQFDEYGTQPKTWGVLGNGNLEHEDDLRWVTFHDAKVTADEAKGLYRASFGKDMASMNGRRFSITGYMMPVEANLKSPHFVLTRRVAGCPFCPPNEPTEAMEVFALAPVAYTQSPVTIAGTLHLVASSAAGLFFRLDKARKL